MRGGGFSSRFRGKEFPLLLIVILGTLVLIWAWDRTPLLATTILLPPTQEFHLSQESSLPNFAHTKDVDPIDQSSVNGYTQRNPPREEAADDTKEKEEQAEVFGDNVSKDNSTMTETEGEHYQNVEKNIQNGKEQVAKMIATESSTNTSSLDTKTETKDNQVVESTEITGADNSTLSGLEEKHHETVVEKDLKQKDDFPDVAVTSSTNSSSLLGEHDDKNSTVIVANQACNYAKGKWVVDDSRPLYSGFDCKQWLAPMWACRLMKRTDFSYEKLRWQPTNCQMEEFEGAKFLKRMQGKTLAFVGDSLGRQQFQSLMCMITGGKESPDVLDVGTEYGLVQPHGGVRPNGWAYRFPSTNTTVLYYWSACLCDLELIDNKNPSTDYAMHLDRPPSFLRRYLPKIDVLVLNTGHHWNRGKLKANRWVMHVGGKPNTNKKLRMIGDAKNFTIHSIIDWVNEQLPKNPHLKAFYRSISPRHFANGDWNTGGSCDNTTPMSIGKEVLQDESSDYSAGHAAKGTGVKLLDVTALSQLRDEGHISKYSITASSGVQDCLHWCLPGVPDTWNEILFALISDMAQVQTQ